MKLADFISLMSIVVAVLAAIIFTFVLLQMKQDTTIARRDSELKIRPILFIKDGSVNVKDDQIDSIDGVVLNAGLGSALRGGFQNSRASLGATMTMHAAWSRASTMKPSRS